MLNILVTGMSLATRPKTAQTSNPLHFGKRGPKCEAWGIDLRSRIRGPPMICPYLAYAFVRLNVGCVVA
jgi:hypothetical protein